MKYLLTYLTVLVSVANGVKWNDFRGGNIELPITQRDAESKGWLLCEQDDTHNVKWFSRNNDWTFSVGFDDDGVCAGVRVIIPESIIDSDYLKLYKQSEGIFEQVEFLGEKAYKSSVLFSPKGYVTKHGQDTKDPDEVAYFAFLKEGANPKMLSRELCDQAEASYTEQGCHSKYGLVLSYFGSETKCKYLKPFYTIYDPNGSSDLIGFGWISFSTVSNPDSIMKPLTTDAAKNIGPKLFNRLPNYIKVVECENKFKASLQHFLLPGAYYSIEEFLIV